jgi:hypothetical protein
LRWHYSRICDVVVDEIGPDDPGKAKVGDLYRSGTQRLNCKAFTTSVAVEVYEHIQLALGNGVGTAAVAPVAWQVDKGMSFFLDLLAVKGAVIGSSGEDVNLNNSVE